MTKYWDYVVEFFVNLFERIKTKIIEIYGVMEKNKYLTFSIMFLIAICITCYAYYLSIL